MSLHNAGVRAAAATVKLERDRYGFRPPPSKLVRWCEELEAVSSLVRALERTAQRLDELTDIRTPVVRMGRPGFCGE